MRIFLSVGEPSGDLHGANLIHEIRKRHPNAEFAGFGGDHMQAAGCSLLYPLCRFAVMWFARVLANLPFFLSLISKTDRYFAKHRPDAVILIDYPGFNWWVARRAHARGIPVFYFVPPQIWGWATWRIKKMQRWVDHVLCTLPFEKDWYEQRHVDAHYVGHPYFDELHEQRLRQGFLNRQKQQGGPAIGLLPGSRTQEVENNFGSMLKAAAIIHEQRPDTRFLVACFKEQHRKMIDAAIRHSQLPIEAFVGLTPEIIEASHSCIAVSGSVSLELLYRQTPTVVVYQISPFDLKVAKCFIKSRFISLVNLIADDEVFPEFLVDHCPSRKAAEQILGWLNDKVRYSISCNQLEQLKNRVAQPGACRRAAAYFLEVMCGGPAAALPNRDRCVA